MLQMDTSSEQNIQVYARFRPPPTSTVNESGNDTTDHAYLSFADTKRSVSVTNTRESGGVQQFDFNRVFEPNTTQEELYAVVGQRVVTDVLHGYHGTILAYGQTGSGKTHTMFGPLSTPRPQGGKHADPTASSQRNGGGVRRPSQIPPERGIIPRATAQIFEHIRRSPVTTSFQVSCQCVEIYMERVQDLLAPDHHHQRSHGEGPSLLVREDPRTSSFYVEGCETQVVAGEEQLMEWVEFGLANRATASTRANDVSSRSHCLFTVFIKAIDAVRRVQTVSKLVLVDLAGSEKVARTKAEGQQLAEAKLINRSLSALGNVIMALCEKHHSHIPYRDSKLTKLLQDSLGGNALTSLVVCCSSLTIDCSETVSTLRFGTRAQVITNRAVVNVQHSVEELKILLQAAQLEITMLKKALLERNPDGNLSGNSAEDEATLSAASPSATEGVRDETIVMVGHAEVMREMQSQLQGVSDQLRDVTELNVALQQRVDHDTAEISELQHEVSLWECEYRRLQQDLVSTSEKLVTVQQEARRIAERWTARSREISHCARQVDALRQNCRSVAVLLEERTQGSTSPCPREPNTDAPATQTPTRPTGGSLRVLDGLRTQLEESENTRRDLQDEVQYLRIELELQRRKLNVRGERINNLKAELQRDREVGERMRMRTAAEMDRLKDALRQAFRDVSFWRNRYVSVSQQLSSASGGAGSVVLYGGGEMESTTTFRSPWERAPTTPISVQEKSESPRLPTTVE